MHTQGNHNLHPGQCPQKPMSSPYQQRPPGPPLPRPPFQQNPSGFTSYPHGPVAPNQIPPGGLENTGQSYLNPSVHVHEGAPLPHLLPTAQQNSQYRSHLGTQNSHNMPQPVHPRLTSASQPDVSQTLPPFRALPPPPPPPQSQVQTFYRAPVNPPPQPGFQHVSSHPPFPPTTDSFTSVPPGGFLYSTGGDHRVLSTPPLPPLHPSSSAPHHLPSTSTVFSSSKPASNASNMPCNWDSYSSNLSASGPVGKDVASNNVKHNLIADNGSLNVGGGNSSGMDSLLGDKISLQDGLSIDLSSCPPKPTNENVIERIEALCQGIAKHGLDYEDIVRKNESGKPEYAFLYGGEPGSEAAIAHDFFQWMKNKSTVACKLDELKGISYLRPSENESSKPPRLLAIAAASRSPDDSDMEMEDDITQVDDDQGMNHSLKGQNSQCHIKDNMLQVEGLLHPLQKSTGCNEYKDILFEKTSAACSSRVGEPGAEGILDAEQMTFGASVFEVNVVKSAVPTEQPVVTNLEKSNDSGQLAKGGSPIRLLEDYASDENSDKDVETGVENTKVSYGVNLGTESGSTLDSASSSCQTKKGLAPLSLSSIPSAVGSTELIEGTFTTSIINGNELADNKHAYQVSANQVASGNVLQKQNVMVGASDNGVKFSEERRQNEENVTLGSQYKVDKFGRLLRNGASDSDSDDLCYIRRHRRGRTRSRSRSHSPPDRRKRRSPQRRRKKRSLSRSWSPRNRRSRSRSPRNRRSRSRSPRNRRSKSRSPRKRRSRSRSPRNRRSRSRSPRNRRSRSRSPTYQRTNEFSGENKRGVKGRMPFCFDFRRGRCYRGMSCRYLHHDYGKSDESRLPRSKQQCQEISQSSRSNACAEIKRISDKVGDDDHGEARGIEVKLYGDNQDSVGGGVHNQDSQSTEYHMVKSEKSRDIPASIFASHLVDNKQGGPNLVLRENSQGVEESHHPPTVDASSVGNIDTLKSCGNSSQNIPIDFKKSVDQKSLSDPLDPMHQNVLCLPQQSDNSSISGSSLHKASTSSPNRLRESNLAKPMELHSHPSHMASPSLPHSDGIDNPHMKQQQTTSSLFQTSGESLPSYMMPNQQSYLTLQPNSSLTSLPPPPPLPPQDSTITPGIVSHIWQVHLPPRNDFGSQIIPRPYPTELPAHSQSDGFQHQAYLPIQEGNQPYLYASLPVFNLPIQQFGAPSMSENDSLTQPTMQNAVASNSFAQGSTHPHAMPFSQQFLGSTTSSTFPNPHASMLDQSINSKYCSDVMQEKDSTYNKTHVILTRPPVDGRGFGLQYTTSSPNSARVIGQNFPRSGGDQYDPIFDSIEPSTRLSRNKLLDMEDNNKKNDAGAVASAASADYEEFGETAGAEIGAVENESPSNPVEVNMATGDIEIDQIKSPGKSKKSKDSRSMKLFRVALADFVKEVLKPSWQQGNMSKEAFKSIVKKTVDKVSGAMKSHRVPKSRAKIDRYIESSQQKLTKLVMGYVDKYV